MATTEGGGYNGSDRRFLVAITKINMFITDKSAIGDRFSEGEGADTGGGEVAQSPRLRVMRVENGDIGLFLEADDIGFGLGVDVHSAVTVEMVGGDIEDSGDGWTLGPDFQLEAREFLDNVIIGTDVGEIEEEGVADIAADPARLAGGGGHGASEGGGGAFAGGASDADSGGGGALEEDGGIVGDGDAALAGLLEEGDVSGNSATNGDEVSGIEEGGGVVAEFEGEGEIGESGEGGGEIGRGAEVGEGDVGAVVASEAGQSGALAGDAHNEQIFAVERVVRHNKILVNIIKAPERYRSWRP